MARRRSQRNPLPYPAAVRALGSPPPTRLAEDSERPGLRFGDARAGAVARVHVPIPPAAPVAISGSPGPRLRPRPAAGTTAEAEPEAEEAVFAGADALLDAIGLRLGNLLLGQRLVDLAELGVADRIGQLLAVDAERLGEGGGLGIAAVDYVVEARVQLPERVIRLLLRDAAVGPRAVERRFGRLVQRLLEAVDRLATLVSDLRERLGPQLGEQLTGLEAEVVAGGVQAAEQGGVPQAGTRGVAQVLDGGAQLGRVHPGSLRDVVEERVAVGSDGGAGRPV